MSAMPFVFGISSLSLPLAVANHDRSPSIRACWPGGGFCCWSITGVGLSPACPSIGGHPVVSTGIKSAQALSAMPSSSRRAVLMRACVASAWWRATREALLGSRAWIASMIDSCPAMIVRILWWSR
jgi:hypothetical protein